MSKRPDGRSRSRQATRQAISDVATRLFMERGFDQVTVDEIAAAAKVGRMTVFNHFPRKEDIFFDLDEAGRDILLDTLRQCDPQVGPIEALRLLAHRLILEHSPFVRFDAESQVYVQTIAASETLKARARAIRDELTQLVRTALTERAAKEQANPDADLAADLVANLLLATWAVAFMQAHRTFRQRQSTKDAEATFLAVIDQGAIGQQAAMAGSPYGSQ